MTLRKADVIARTGYLVRIGYTSHTTKDCVYEGTGIEGRQRGNKKNTSKKKDDYAIGHMK